MTTTPVEPPERPHRDYDEEAAGAVEDDANFDAEETPEDDG